MPIEGLQTILQKQEVVPTFNAIDLLERAVAVDEGYSRHVRTYIPVSRAAQGNEEAVSVSEFEKSIIRAIKNGRAPRGYLTAEYGYGKTSTALYLWKRAEEAGLLAVPPFQLLHLVDILSALYGWMKYRLRPRAPHLLDEVEMIYQQVTGRNIEREACKRNVPLSVLTDLYREGRLILDLQPHEYIEFFKQATDIVLRAGFEGILILPDEIQQYIEPLVRTETEPITPLFNLVQQQATREGYLKLGIILVIPKKELGMIRELRQDLLDRLADHHLDLTMVYDEKFAANLWNRLAREFDFEDIASNVTASDSLTSLGEIAARDDISNGPRTVINTFHRMVEKYLAFPSKSQPYSPLNLVEDLISGAIVFTGDDRIPSITRRALQHQIVQRDPLKFEPAVKMAAAFPTNGIPYLVQQKYDVVDALEELRRLALGELVISAGDERLRGVTLFGLHRGVQQSDWLTQTVRDFRRSFGEQHQMTQERAIRAFEKLLCRDIFKGWTVVRSSESSMVSNHSILFEGDFSKFQARFPKRRVQARILWEDEERKDANIEGDIAIEFQLTTKTDLRNDPEARRSFAQPVCFEFENQTAIIPLNLMHLRPEGIPENLKSQLQSVWAPYDLAPLIFLNLFELMEEKRAEHLIPPREDQMIANGFQPEMMDTVRKSLFNDQVGASVGGMSQAHMVEEVIFRLLDKRYVEYETFMLGGNWRSALLTDYSNALSRLTNVYQKRGEIEVEGTKEQIASFLARTNVGLDTFIRVYKYFLTVTRTWARDTEGSVRFTLHPLEKKIKEWLKLSPKVEAMMLGAHRVEVHVIDSGIVYRQAHEMGYRDEEIETAITLLIKRDLVEQYLYLLREVPSQTVDLDAATELFGQYEAAINALQKGFGDQATLKLHVDRLPNIRQALDGQRQTNTPDPQKVFQLSHSIRRWLNELDNFAKDQKGAINRTLSNLQQNFLLADEKKISSLDQAVNGAVDYVQQVNVLRSSLHNHVLRVKEALEKTRLRLSNDLVGLQQDNLSYEALSNFALGLGSITQEVQRSNHLKTGLDEQLKHFSEWITIVERGSDLFNDLNELGEMTRDQKNAFDAIGRTIREEISSKGNKLEALPKHPIYSQRLAELRQQVRTLKGRLEDEFVTVKNGYIQALIEKGLYRRDEVRLDIPFNPADVESAYRLVYEKVQELSAKLCDQLLKKANEEKKGVEILLYSGALAFLLNEQKENIKNEGDDLIAKTKQVIEQSIILVSEVKDEQIIKDLAGKYGTLIGRIIEQRNTLGEIDVRYRKLSQQLHEVSLTPEEERLMKQWPASNIDQEIDLVDWLKLTNLPEDEFWKLLRSLYGKHRVRIQILKVRT